MNENDLQNIALAAGCLTLIFLPFIQPGMKDLAVKGVVAELTIAIISAFSKKTAKGGRKHPLDKELPWWFLPAFVVVACVGIYLIFDRLG